MKKIFIALLLLASQAFAQTITPPITMKGTYPDNAYQLSIKQGRNSSGVMADFVQTVSGVDAYADIGAARFIAKHYGPNQGLAASTADADLRAVEAHCIRAFLTSGGCWAMELGVHTETVGMSPFSNLGLFIHANHTGWTPSGTGVRADTAIMIVGDDGWKNALTYLDIDGTTKLFNVDQFGSVYGRSSVIGGREAGTTVLRTTTDGTGATIRAEGFDFSGARELRLGSDFNTYAVLTSSALKPNIDGGLALGAADKRYSTLYANAATISGPVRQIPAASATPAAVGEMVFEATNNTTLTVRVKGTDGVVRSGIIRLQ